MVRPAKMILAVVVVSLVAVAAWRYWRPNDERDVRRRLNALASDFNESTTDGLGAVARAARMGAYFTEDIVVDLGQGAPPIRGRETMMGMAARLQPRTAAFSVELLDINVKISPPSAADVSLTAAFRRRNPATGEEIDAQELALRMSKADGEWRISHVTAVEPFK